MEGGFELNSLTGPAGTSSFVLPEPCDSASWSACCLLLCKQRNRLVAEYALRGIDSPMGVAEYRLIEALPQALANSLPSIEDIERELGGIDRP